MHDRAKALQALPEQKAAAVSENLNQHTVNPFPQTSEIYPVSVITVGRRRCDRYLKVSIRGWGPRV